MSGSGTPNNVEVRITGSVDPSLASSTATAQATMNQLAAAEAGVGPAASNGMEAAEEATHKFTLGTVRARTEVIVLAHEMIQGRFSRIPGSLMVMAEAMGGVSLATWGIIGAVAAVAGVYGYLAYESHEAAVKLDELVARQALLGQDSEQARGFLAAQRAQLEEMPGVSKKVAEAVLDIEASNAQLNDRLREQLTQIVPAFVKAYGDDAPAKLKTFSEAIASLSLDTFPKLNQEQLHLNATQTTMIDKMLQAGQTAQAQTAIFEILGQRAGVAIVSIDLKIAEHRQHLLELQVQSQNLMEHGLGNSAAWHTIQAEIAETTSEMVALENATRNAAVASDQLMNTQLYSGAEGKGKPKKGPNPFKGTGFSNAGSEIIAEARETIGEIDAMETEDAMQRLARERSVWAALLNGDRLNAAQRIEIKRELSHIDRELADQRIKDAEIEQKRQKEISDAELAEFIRTDQERLSEGLRTIEDDFRAHRISAQERHDLEMELTREIEAEVLERFDAEHAGLVKGTVDYAKAMKDRAALVAKFSKDVQTINLQLAQQERQVWTTAFGSIRSTVGNEINAMLFQGETFGQGMANIAGGVLQAFVTAGENMAADWIARQLESLFETESIQASKGAAQIASEAAVAAAAAFASTAAIPIIGPELAPAAAASAYAATMSFQSLVGLDVGAWNIPKAQPYLLHPGEMVVPKTFAQGLRSTPAFDLGAGGAGGAGQRPIDMTIEIHAIDTQTGLQFLDRNIPAIAKKLKVHLGDTPSSRADY